LVVGVDSDALYPLELQKSIAMAVPGGSLAVLSSPHGHDGFLIEIARLNTVVAAWMRENVPPSVSASARL
jgi:homoserine acetyltransferase